MKVMSLTVNHDAVVKMHSFVDPRVALLALVYELPERLKRFMVQYDQPITVFCELSGAFDHPITPNLNMAGYDLKVLSIFDSREQRQLTPDEFDYCLALLNTQVKGIELEKVA